jgi:hypothetical protein
LGSLQTRLLLAGAGVVASVRRLFLEGLQTLHAAGELQFFTDLAALGDHDAFNAYLAPVRRQEWVVYAKRPFAGPSQVLAYLARYTHRVAIANSRLLSLSSGKVRFRWKDYRHDGQAKVMTLEADEFIRRFLLHVLPDGFHRIRYYGLFANGHRVDKITQCRKLLDAAPVSTDRNNDNHDDQDRSAQGEQRRCPCCGGRMTIIEIFDGPLSRPYHIRRRE